MSSFASSYSRILGTKQIEFGRNRRNREASTIRRQAALRAARGDDVTCSGDVTTNPITVLMFVLRVLIGRKWPLCFSSSIPPFVSFPFLFSRFNRPSLF